MKRFFRPVNILYLLAISFIVNSFVIIERLWQSLFLIIPAFVLINVFAGARSIKTKSTRLRICSHGGTMLCIFVFSTLVSLIFHIAMAFVLIPDNYMTFIWSAVFCICTETIVFFNGIISVYCTSLQLGIKLRVVGLLCGMIPVANLLALRKIISTVMEEASFEAEKEVLNESRRDLRICKTKYPILLVHGVFFRDSQYFNYWGRVPKELEANGARIFYGEHQSAASVADSALELTERIKNIVSETGCEKLNIIAHSKGGLDCRYAIAKLGAEPYVASLTTINTPHRGCIFADYLLGKIPAAVKNRVADTYNAALRRLGDRNPDFIAAITDLTATACEKFDAELTVSPPIYCQSVGSRLNKATGGKFPLNLSYHLVKHFDGGNDGLVSENAFSWGEKSTFIAVQGDRGVSHGDMIDLNRENIKGFDVREFYVGIVSDLKQRGL